MRHKRAIFFSIIILLFPTFSAFGLTSPQPQYGVGARLIVDILHPKGRGIWMNYKFALSGGVAYNFNWYTNNFYRPNLHLDFVVMKGGIGTREFNLYKPSEKPPRSRAKGTQNMNGFMIATLHFIQYGSNIIPDNGNYKYQGKPLYYFSDFTYPVLTNPFKQSLSFGTSWIYNMSENKCQRASNFNGSCRSISFSYSNDGPPFSFRKILGDEKDRWFTGDGMLNQYNNRRIYNYYEIAYHKFTGWHNMSYETCVDLGATEVNYKDPKQNLFNSTLLSIRMISGSTSILDTRNKWLNSKSSSGFALDLYDWYGMDIQHLIHYKAYYSHHISPNPFRWGLSFYGQLTNQQSKLQ